jgi:DNA mismatch endonuclease (patch repair protein)
MPTSGTLPELRLESALRGLGAPSWERSPRDGGGPKPDLFWRHHEVAVFVDGCQWHGCAEHYRPHAGNGSRHGLTNGGVLLQQHTDRVGRAAMEAKGVRVLAFWEHELETSAGTARVAAVVMDALREPWRR